MKKIKALVNYIIFLIKKGVRAYVRYGFKEMITRARRYRGRTLQYAHVSNLSDDMQQERRRLDQFMRDHEGKKKIVFFSTNESWGGSEVGCAHMARGFAREGWAVMLCMVRYVQIPKMLQTIQEEGEIFLLERTSTGGPDGTMNIISTFNPDIVIISQGHLFEGLACMQWFESQHIAYANFIPLAEKTHTQFLPHTGIIQEHARLLNQSKIIFLDNHRAKETIQEIHGVINVPFHVVYNYDVDFDQPITWDEPTLEKPFRLIVLGRLDITHKGLDMLVSAVNADKWRQRPLQIMLYGSGLDEEILRKKIKQDNLVNIVLAGPTDNQAEVLLNSHGLIFASRMEGTPLALIEAMLCHRMAIVTPVGGMPEIIQDGKNGFLASGVTKEAIDEVLERAWNQRHLWQTMGLDAGVSIRNKVQKFPFQSCSDILKKIVTQKNTPSALFIEHALNMTLKEWIDYHQTSVHFNQRYRGLRMIKNPFDLIIYEEMIWEIRPTIIIEIGNAFGGFSLWLSDRMRMMNIPGKIITIDLSSVADTHLESHDQVSSTASNIISLVGDCNSSEILDHVASHINDNDRVLIIEDSAHTFEHTIAVLNNYHKFVSPGSYFIIEDGICDLMNWINPGPMHAVEAWTPDHPEFSLDRTKERYIVTYNPKGYLKRHDVTVPLPAQIRETASEQEIEILKKRMDINNLTF